MQIIKPLLILCFILVLVSAFRHRERVGLRAGSRILAIVLAAIAIIAVLDPDIPQALAEVVGVARGTDLILYTAVVVFTLTTLGLYFRLREVSVRLQMLARRIALSDAVQESGPPRGAGSATGPPVAAGESLLPELTQSPVRDSSASGE